MKKDNKKITNKFVYEKEEYIKNIANADIDNIETNINSKIGLTDQQRLSNVQKFGENKLIEQKFFHWKKIGQILIEPFNLLLLAIGIAEFLIFGLYSMEIIDLVSGIIVILMIFLAGSVDYVQEHKAFNSNKKLHALVENEFSVYVGNPNIKDIKKFNLKKHDFKKIDQTKLTIGDLVLLNAGDIIPSDSRILWATNLTVDESTLTGESQAVTKHLTNESKNLLGLNNILFSQTVIKTGSCLAVVVNIAENNYANSIMNMVSEDDIKSDYEKGINKVTKILVISILSIVPIILLIAGLRTNNWITATIFALSIAVSLTPEALPAIISSNLQLAARKLSKERVVIKKLSVMQNLGSVDILCTDKTGTLTIDKISLDGVVDFNNNSSKDLNNYLLYSSYFQRSLSNKMDLAILEKFKDSNIDSKIKIVDLKEFNHESRTSSVLLSFPKEKKQILKGSVNEVIKTLSYVRDKSEIRKITKEDINKINEKIIDLSNQGYRTLLIATTKTDKLKNKDFIFEGFAYFGEVVKGSVIEAIKTLYKYNIDLKILTGDSVDVSLNVAKKINMKNQKALTGDNLNSINKEELSKLIETANIFAKLSPVDKAKIVDQYKNDKHVIAFMGDGVNDAIALKVADVGISVNNGTPLAKASADVILLEKDLLVLENAFVKGRQTFTNAIKYIKITVAANFGLMFSLLISTLWFNFPAMSPLQLLLQNLIYDFANLIFVFDKVDDSSIRKPLSWNTKSIFPFAIWNGLISTIISITNFLIIGYGMGLFNEINNGTIDVQEMAIKQFQTIFFLESMITHMMLIIIYRTEKISLIQSRPSWVLGIGIIGFTGVTLLITYIKPIANIINFVDPKPIWWLIMLGLIIATYIIGELSKKVYIKVFKNWF